MTWQPIDTAPKDRRLLVWTGQNSHCAQWVQNPYTGDEAWMIAITADNQQVIVKATHWQPLPEPPQPAVLKA